MSGALTQFGIGTETVYGTGVAVTKSYEISKEAIKGKYHRVQADALSAAYVDRADRFVVANKGATGNLTLEPLSKSFNHWLRFMMGIVATGAVTDGTAYTHTGTIGSQVGDSFTCQVMRSDSTDTLRPWTYEGGKITDWEFTNQVDQTLKCNLGVDFRKESNPNAPAGIYSGTALNALSTPAGAEVLAWQGGLITLGGTEFPVTDVSVKCDNALKTDRYYIASQQTKKEPIQDGKRKITYSFKSPYDDNGMWARVSAATAAGTYAALVCKWTGLTLAGASTVYPSLTITIPVCRFDDGGPVVDTPGMLEATYTGVGLYDGTNSAVTIAYTSTDAVSM